MPAGLKHHLCAAENRLRRKVICLRSRHPVRNSRIRHRLYEHVDIRRGTSAQRCDDPHQALRDLLRLTERCNDAGADSIGRSADPEAVAAFLADLERENALPRTILYNLNPADNMLFATMAVNFAPTVRYGAAWWFNDNIRGMKRQLEELMETGALALFPGMLTDSRSFTAFVRHEYFRRILCAKLGRVAEEGLYPADTEVLGEMVKAVCYQNAVNFFLPE